MVKYQNFYLKIFIFLLVKFSVYLNRRVFVMNMHVFMCTEKFVVYFDKNQNNIEQ